MPKLPKTSNLETYRRQVRSHLETLTDALARISVGDLASDVKRPKKEDEFTDLYVGLQLMLEVFRENLDKLHRANRVLTRGIKEAQASSTVIEQEKVVDEAILNSIGEGLIVTDTDGRIFIMNKQAEILLDLEAASVVGKSFFKAVKLTDMLGRNLEAKKGPPLLSITKKRKITKSDICLTTKTVKELPVVITSSPIMLGETVIGSVSVFRDTRQERDIDRAKSEVISFTSHQLRTPLSVINWYSEALINGHMGPINQQQREYLEAILFTARRMIELVNTFLSVSRIQLGKLVVDIKPLDLEDIIKTVYEELKPQVTQRDLKFNVDFAKNTPDIKGDEKLLRVVFQNLIGNAVKYTPSKGVIAVETNPIRPSDGLPVKEGVLVVIRDTGYGIPKKQQDKIFTKLFRAQNAQKINTEGSGLGLYMVKSLVNYCGGDVWFRSWLNKGTIFFVALPTIPIIKEKVS
jgi:signal transduction histidine kinase